MSANPQPPKGSKWSMGSFLQSAVAGVESRLDTILAEEAEEEARGDGSLKDADKVGTNAEQLAPRGASPAPVKVPSTGISRSSSSARTNARLQERLARALVKQGGGTNIGSPPSSTGVPSRTPSPLPMTESRTSLDTSGGKLEEAPAKDDISVASSGPDINLKGLDEIQDQCAEAEEPALRPSISSDRNTGRSSTSADRSRVGSIPEIGVTGPPTEQPNDYEVAMQQLQADHEAEEVRWQEELHGYVERIDALQSKLKYLAKEAADSARNAAATAGPGSPERKILEKDEQIAALMEEGQKLSKTELEHRATIKKLRVYIANNSKDQAESKKRIEKLEKDLSKAEDRARRAEQAEKRATSKLSSQSKMGKELESVTAERDASNATIIDLKSQLAKTVARAEATERRLQADSSDSRRVAELKDDLSSAKVEREISEGKLRREIADLKEDIKRQKERAEVQEMEFRGEQSVLESKMESLRSRAEEVSSSATGDAQAHLLRQIETLQTQYAVARENWHGIESSLQSRLANVEKERDEISKRETELRRKVREANLKTKRVEGDLENSRELSQETERDLEQSKEEMQKLVQKFAKVENDLLAAKQDLTTQKEHLEATWTRRLEDEKTKWQEHLQNSNPYLPTRAESPVAFSRKSADTLATLSERPQNRRSPNLPTSFFGTDTPPRQDSYSSFNSHPGLRHPSNDGGSPATGLPSVHTLESEEYFNGAGTPATPSAPGTHSHIPRGVNDVVSVSTVAAGPSVQLVERMSAAIRRLESERAASKEELAGLAAQRDEAREEIVELMKEVEEKRSSDQKLQELEAQVAELDERYQTTLEMLGEKSELVEEQRADIDDLKRIYRDLVESTMK